MSENTKQKSKISKDEINQLPIQAWSGKTILVKSNAEMEQALVDLNNTQVLGFDTESRPAFKAGQKFSVSLLQLATEKNVYLFRLNEMGLTKELTDILANPKLIKTGVAVHDDIKGLQELHFFEPGNFQDLSDIAKAQGIITLGLRSLAALLLDFRITKTAKLTNWEQTKLTSAQISYAATDAWVSRELYLNLSK